MRLLKEKFTESEMMKQANRRGFSVETGEYGDDAMGLTLGMLEKTKDGSSYSSGSPKVRSNSFRVSSSIRLCTSGGQGCLQGRHNLVG